ncbi:unnamed protein product [Rhizoctonia solani]|uniref:Uncharacterized protein n=1 Tax=Rhizoctonia solani TaxID=456999 RepID=A0A8H3A9N7_9AGAM|nr:unnamed protein product [Rhizoctonia solani]
MNTQQDDLAASGAREGAPLIDFAQDVVQDYHPERDTTHVERSQGVQESTTSVRESLLQNELGPETPSQWMYNSTFPPARSIRELVECLGSPVYSNTSDSPRNTLINPRASRPSTTPPSPSLFTDPASFGEQEPTDLNVISRSSTYSGSSSSCERDLNRNLVSAASIDHVTLHPPFENIPTLEQSLERDHIGWSMGPIGPPSQLSTAPLQPSFALNRPTVPAWLDSPAPPPPTLSPTLSIPPILSSTRSDFPYARPTPPRPIRSQPLTRPLPRAPESMYDHDPIPPPAHPWNTHTTVDPISRPDRFSRTTAHTAISDILFNFDLDPATATDLIDDACQTARQVGVSTYDLLSRSVFLGTSDLGITPLCLEASRVDVDSGLELVLWLIENTRPGEVCAEVKRGCLMRRNGMGEQVVWNVLRSFIPSVDGEQALAYDVEVEGLAVVPGGHIPSVATTQPVESETTLVDDDDDEGSLYDDVSIIDAESGFLDQADIETLKSSSDESDKGKEKAQESGPEPVPSRVHRARIVMPEFKESLMGPSWSYTHLVPSNRFGLASSGPLTNKVLTAEWMFEGRLWALSIGEETIILTLRQTSTFVSSDPIQVKAIVRILPPDIQWTGVEEIDHIESDRLLPTQTPNDVLLPSPLYECEFEEKQLVPGPVGVGMNSSVWRTEIRVSMFSLLELVEPHNGIKIEVVVRVTDRERDMNMASTSGCARDDAGVADGASIADDASDWQLVDD